MRWESIALVVLLALSACAKDETGKRTRGFPGDYRAAATYCHERGARWFKFEAANDLVCYEDEQPGTFNVEAVLAEERIGEPL